jgi:hypothetical protein
VLAEILASFLQENNVEISIAVANNLLIAGVFVFIKLVFVKK